ncbi:unnamed protein product [Prorocentrum cordatum]|uniref:Protein S-acyltransferase n=1 Tax=Prorocentrum cordatum TaxID=2364126 RepID=A0ABN9UC14_9DINO|nr:unnamed protein product [Polarella glacialis]
MAGSGADETGRLLSDPAGGAAGHPEDRPEDHVDKPQERGRQESRPYFLGCYPFFVGEVLELKNKEKKATRAHCVGPVMALALWCPVIHALVMFSFMGLGLMIGRRSQTGGTLDLAYPKLWLALAACTCFALMCLEVHIAKYSSTWYSDKARNQSKNNGQIGWPCMPVHMLDGLLRRCCSSSSTWSKFQDTWYFHVWFIWLFGLGTVTLYSRLQANAFLGVFVYGYFHQDRSAVVSLVWQETLRQSRFIREYFPLSAILLIMFIAQILHYAFGVINFWPRCGWKTTDHKRWQTDPTSDRSKWMAWGRSFELEVKGMDNLEKTITDRIEWDFWRGSFKGGFVEAHRPAGEISLSGPPGGPLYSGGHPYEPSEEDFPLIIKWTSNRFAYTTLTGAEATSSTVLDGVAECCSMSIMLEMHKLELKDWRKANDLLVKYEDRVKVHNNAPTEKMSGALIQEVRTLLNDAVNVTRCAFSRIFIYGVCFCGVHLHFQVTYTNALCSGTKHCPNAQKALRLGIASALVSMLLVLAKVVDITRYLCTVLDILRRYGEVLHPEHATLKQLQSMLNQIRVSKFRLIGWSVLMVPACLTFVWNFSWLCAKWAMDSFVCPSHMWNVPALMELTNPVSGCVDLNDTTFSVS